MCALFIYPTVFCVQINSVKQKNVQHFFVYLNWSVFFFKQRFWHFFWHFIENKVFDIRHFEISIHCIISDSVLIRYWNRWFFLLYRLFIENRHRYIKLTAIVIFTAIFIAFSTSFGFVLRTQSYDCFMALFTFVFAFNTICSSGRFKIYEKIPFLFCFLW